MRKLLRLVFIAGVVFGSVESWNWLRHRKAVEVIFTSNEVRELPKHVLLKNVFLLPTDVASKPSLGGKQLYIPVRAMDDDSPAKTLHFVLKTDDPELVAAVEQANAGSSLADAMVALKPLLSRREISGMLDSSALTNKQRLQLREQFPILAEDFTVIDEGRHPSLFSAGFLFAVGGLALFVLGKIDPSVIVPEPAAPETPSVAAAPTAAPSLPVATSLQNLAPEPPPIPASPSTGFRPPVTAREPGVAIHEDDPVTAGPIDVQGKRVAVLGGGDTAMDCLRTALRSGAHGTVCLYRRDLANMPGSRKEYANALEEGAQFRFLTNPVALLGDADGRVKAVRCVRMELGAPDASGRRSPKPVAGSEFETPADLVLVAYGFDPVPFPADSDLAQVATDKWGGFKVDENQMTNVPGVFVGGDSVRGPSLVVHAVRDARRATQGIHRWLGSRQHA